MKRLGGGGRVSWGWLRQGVSNASGRKTGRVQCVRTRKSASRRIRRGPFTSEPNEPGRTHPEPEFTLQVPGTSSEQGERGETEHKVFSLLMYCDSSGNATAALLVALQIYYLLNHNCSE